jgi:hypothetical protein
MEVKRAAGGALIVEMRSVGTSTGGVRKKGKGGCGAMGI